MGFKDAFKSAFVQDYSVSFGVYFFRMFIGLVILTTLVSLFEKYVLNSLQIWGNIGFSVVILIVYSFGYFNHKK